MGFRWFDMVRRLTPEELKAQEVKRAREMDEASAITDWAVSDWYAPPVKKPKPLAWVPPWNKRGKSRKR